MNQLKITSFLVFFFLCSTAKSQEVVPEKTYHFVITLNSLKTEEQANQIKADVAKIRGVKNCSLVLTDYFISFDCTNIDLEENLIIELVKNSIISNNAEIIKITQIEKK